MLFASLLVTWGRWMRAALICGDNGPGLKKASCFSLWVLFQCISVICWLTFKSISPFCNLFSSPRCRRKQKHDCYPCESHRTARMSLPKRQEYKNTNKYKQIQTNTNKYKQKTKRQKRHECLGCQCNLYWNNNQQVGKHCPMSKAEKTHIQTQILYAKKLILYANAQSTSGEKKKLLSSPPWLDACRPDFRPTIVLFVHINHKSINDCMEIIEEAINDNGSALFLVTRYDIKIHRGDIGAHKKAFQLCFRHLVALIVCLIVSPNPKRLLLHPINLVA